jgi:hypothetical protein
VRILFALIALVLLGTFAPPALFIAPTAPAASHVVFEAVPLDPENPARRRVGGLTYLGGWVLTSEDARFGGISGMHIQDGSVLAISDAGTLFRFPLASSGASPLEVRALPQGPGAAGVKSDRDAEALTVHGNHAWIGFERRNAVWRYRVPGWESDADAAPSALAGWHGNAGSEGMLRLAGGRFLIFAEGLENAGQSEAVLFDRDPALPAAKWKRLRYRAPKGYRLTDAAALADGRMLLLNRAFTYLDGMSAKLTIARLPGEDADLIEGREIAHLAPPLTVDNMEALSVTREKGRTIVWMASDDNFMPIQRTLLLKFVLAD